jgi:ketosteroid isomerase-like protein
MKDMVDPQTTQAIRALSSAYDQATNKNDAAALAALYTEDAVFVTDAGTVYGRQEIKKWHEYVFEQLRPKNHISAPDEKSPHTIGSAANDIWATGDWSETIQGQDGVTIHHGGYWSAVDTREGDVWKIRMLTWNITPSPPAKTK